MHTTCLRNCLAELLRRRGQGQGQFRCPYRLSPARGCSVKDRSKKKRVHALEVATERWKVVSKVLTVVDALKNEEEHVTPLKPLEILRPQFGLTKPHKVAHFVRRSPQLFEVCRDSRGVMWAGLSSQAEAIVEEEAGGALAHGRPVHHEAAHDVGRTTPADQQDCAFPVRHGASS